MREVCLWLPEAQESISHGSCSFKIRRKTFAYYLVNHHGDGRVALWVNAGYDLQQSCVASDSRQFFVPPYVGQRGWLGVNLDKGLSWKRIADLARAAYERCAPAALVSGLGATPAVKPPTRTLRPDAVDPLRSARGRAFLKVLRRICAELPEAHEGRQFGYPAWQAGRRTFAMARCAAGALTASFWVGALQQQLLTADPRYRIPPYRGHAGWIDVDVSAGCDRAEMAALALQSYRHFALKRMMRTLEDCASK